MESSTPDSISEVDVFAAETIENWYPTYDLLRSECPVYHVPDTETYFLTRYQDIHQILRKLYTSFAEWRFRRLSHCRALIDN